MLMVFVHLPYTAQLCLAHLPPCGDIKNMYLFAFGVLWEVPGAHWVLPWAPWVPARCILSPLCGSSGWPWEPPQVPHGRLWFSGMFLGVSWKLHGPPGQLIRGHYLIHKPLPQAPRLFISERPHHRLIPPPWFLLHDSSSRRPPYNISPLIPSSMMDPQ